MPIQPLLEIVVRHPFFASGVCTEVQVEPDPATAATLRNLRLVPKRIAGRLAVLVDLDPGGAPRVPVPAARLRFQLRRLPNDLLQVTDLAPLRPGAIFTDEGHAEGPLRLVIPDIRARETFDKPEGATTMVLSGRPRPGASAADFTVIPPANGIRLTDYDPAGNRIGVEGSRGGFMIEYPVAPPRPKDILAFIEIAVGPEAVAQVASGAPRQVVVPLQAVSARWCYHVVTNISNPLAEWRIARSNGAADGSTVSFGNTGPTEIAADAVDDSFGAGLKRRAPTLRVLRFLSDAPVATSERSLSRLGLFAGGTQLFESLPNPSPGQVRRIGGETAFCEVLRVLTV